DPATSQTFGTKPQFSTLQVVEPQIGARLLVLDPDTGNYSYVNAADVGPSGPPPARSSAAVVRGALGTGARPPAPVTHIYAPSEMWFQSNLAANGCTVTPTPTATGTAVATATVTRTPTATVTATATVATVSITNVSPNVGGYSTTVTITGTGFVG